MTRQSPSLGRAHFFSIVVLAFAAVLVWWGAAVTTKDVGLAVPDWPLSFGQVNPDGWFGKQPLLLEHGHRLIASLVGTLTAMLFLWVWLVCAPSKVKALAEFIALLAVLAVIVIGVARGYALETANSQAAAGNTNLRTGNPAPWFAIASIGGLVCLAWLGFSWARRGWPPALRLAALGLIVVELQAVLGGLRVTEMSNAFGILHGCLGQGFFCLLLLVALVTAPWWEAGRPLLPENVRRMLLNRAFVLFGTAVLQLAVGATMRHTHRIGLAANDIVTTGGSFFPGFGSPDLLILFAHKLGAVLLFLVTLAFGGFALRHLSGAAGIRRAALAAAVLVNVQICLGIFVLQSGKSFWVTNFHVITGLTILAVTLFILARSFASVARGPLLAEDPPGASTGRGGAAVVSLHA